MEGTIGDLYRAVRGLDITSDIRRFAGQNAEGVPFTGSDLTYLKSSKIRLIAKAWGYDYDTGPNNNYEAETHRHQPWGRMIQYFTDSLMRVISHVNQRRHDMIMYGDLFVTHFDDNLLRLLDGDLVTYQRGIRDLLTRYLGEPGVAESFRDLCTRNPKNAPMAAVVGVARFIVCMAMGDFDRARAVAIAIMDLKTRASSSSSSSSSSSRLSWDLDIRTLPPELQALLRSEEAAPAPAPAPEPAPLRPPPSPEPLLAVLRRRYGSEVEEEDLPLPSVFDSLSSLRSPPAGRPRLRLSSFASSDAARPPVDPGIARVLPSVHGIPICGSSKFFFQTPLRKLGNGAYGSVYMGCVVLNEDGTTDCEKYVVKVQPVRELLDTFRTQEALRPFDYTIEDNNEVYRRASELGVCPRVLQIMMCDEPAPMRYIIMEKLEGTAADWRGDSSAYEESVHDLFYRAFDDGRGFIHLDAHPQNYMYRLRADGSPEYFYIDLDLVAWLPKLPRDCSRLNSALVRKLTEYTSNYPLIIRDRWVMFSETLSNLLGMISPRVFSLPENRAFVRDIHGPPEVSDEEIPDGIREELTIVQSMHSALETTVLASVTFLRPFMDFAAIVVTNIARGDRRDATFDFRQLTSAGGTSSSGAAAQESFGLEHLSTDMLEDLFKTICRFSPRQMELLKDFSRQRYDRVRLGVHKCLIVFARIVACLYGGRVELALQIIQSVTPAIPEGSRRRRREFGGGFIMQGGYLLVF